ncbi:fasciclin domain-containing protein [Sphingobacterium alkalisoli]|nr:fasciclin domain-containing protein [Sphingobacterium alkalisoli]
MMKSIIKQVALIFVLTTLLFACKEDEYYTDGGRAEAVFDGTIMDYLDAKPREFDTIAQIVRLAGLEDKFTNEEFTFFAPRDEDIKQLIGSFTAGGLNAQLYALGLDTIKVLSDVDPVIWNFYLHRHIFNGKNKLADYPQVDYSLMNVYGGQYYQSQGDAVCNIGVVFNDAISSDGKSVLRYMGYRQLHMAYISDLSNPDVYGGVAITSSDIQPHNGVIHVLDYTQTEFGYRNVHIGADIIQSKR